MGNKITFAEAVAAIVVHHAKLYNLLLAALPAYSGGKTPPRKELLNCEENDAHLLLERLATATKAAQHDSLGEHPDILIAECRDFLHFQGSNPRCSTGFGFCNHKPETRNSEPSLHTAISLKTAA